MCKRCISVAESVQQWVSTVGFDKLTDANGNSSPRLINEAVTASLSGSSRRGSKEARVSRLLENCSSHPLVSSR